MLRKPAFWLSFAFLSIASVIFTLRYFADAFPLVSLDLHMDRSQALTKAAKLATTHQWGPPEFSQVASFQLDRSVQYFVELEAGGNEGFRELLAGNLYAPYKWVVRHFQQGKIRDLRIFFTPSGEFYGFTEQLPENEAGPSLANNTALSIAETTATTQFGLDLSSYERIEESQEMRPGGRIDHSFVYERPKPTLGEGHYRLRLNVAGDRLSGIVHFVEVPEAFDRRYTEMRSVNDTIASVSSIGMLIVYIIGGIIGLFFLLRQGWLVWRPALYWGLFVAGLQFLDDLNQIPLSWMMFETALTETTHVIGQILEGVANFVIMTVLMTISFMAAENLSRRAFPHHIQFWRLWSTEGAASAAVVGRTLGGYLLVGPMLAFVVAFYFLNSRLLGWWNPSDALFEPDVLAVYFPWLTSIARSLQAGFWEECLFRAVPLAGGALLGARFGQRGLWIGAAFILQIAIFGGGHANYPAQPAYARVVELIIPSVLFGALYLVYGLLPAIVLHFIYDVVWFALPVFVSKAPGIWLDRVLVVLLALIPLWIILLRRWRNTAWNDLPDSLFNRSWSPTPTSQPATSQVVPPSATQATDAMSQTYRGLIQRMAGVGGLVGLVLWFYTTPFDSPAPPLQISTNEVQERSRTAFAEHQIDLPLPWRMSTIVKNPLDDQHAYIWREGGKKAYDQLMGSYLSPPHWIVRHARFDEETDVADRAEEFQAIVGPDGHVRQIRHLLPEDHPGATLEEAPARILAETALNKRYGLGPERLKKVSAEPQKQPKRRDWRFTFRDSLGYPLNEGEARLMVGIAGDEIVSTGRYIHIPEEWERRERDRKNLLKLIRLPCLLVLVIGILAAIVFAIINWSRSRFALSSFVRVGIPVASLGLITGFNSWPDIEHGFTTAEPLTNQILMSVAGILLPVLFLSFVIALLAGFGHIWQRPIPAGQGTQTLTGIALGSLVAGAIGLLNHLFPPLTPLWPTYDGTTHYIPMLSGTFGAVLGVAIPSIGLLLFFSALNHFTSDWSRRRGLATLIIFLVGIGYSIVSTDSLDRIPTYGIAVGLLTLGLYVSLLRYSPVLLFGAIGTSNVLDHMQQVSLNPYPSALLIGALSFAATVATTVLLSRLFLQPTSSP